LSFSRSTIYELIAQGKLIARKIGARTLIETQSIKDLIASLPRL
jgi:excisionase family DNA binding protein